MASSHYFDPEPAAASRPGEVRLVLGDGQLALRTDRGVFSAGRADPGTLVLLRSVPDPPVAGELLDLGCGYGPIACTLARRAPGATVWAVDVNRRARELTSANAARLGLSNVRVVEPSEVDPALRFSAIWSNPPVRVGKEALHGLLATWLARLTPEASAWLVVKRHLGADSLAAWLASEGYEVARAASKQGYRLLQVGPGRPA